MTRIGLQDTLQDVVVKLSDGNPGAITVMAQIIKNAENVDPDSAFGPLGPLLDLDTNGIYGPKIWILYKDICGEDIKKVLGMLRAVQLGLLSETRLQQALEERPNTALSEMREYASTVVDAVKAKLPAFAAA